MKVRLPFDELYARPPPARSGEEARGISSTDPDLTLTVDRHDLDTVMTGEVTFADLVADGRATMEGDAQLMAQLMATLVQFTPDFEMLPGTSGN
ncbi:MAG: alkyl sulfatase C-terminal domain-containing protein [Gemmatimonadota bacterium]